MKVIVSFSVDTHLVDRLRLACMHKRVSFSQYAEFALESAPPLTEELAIQLARKRRGLNTKVCPNCNGSKLGVIGALGDQKACGNCNGSGRVPDGVVI